MFARTPKWNMAGFGFSLGVSYMDPTKQVAAFTPLAAMSTPDLALAAMAEAPVLAACTPVVAMAVTASVTVSDASLSALSKGDR